MSQFAEAGGEGRAGGLRCGWATSVFSLSARGAAGSTCIPETQLLCPGSRRNRKQPRPGLCSERLVFTLLK